MSKGWIARAGGGMPSHVMPINDEMPHTESPDCFCRPTNDGGGIFVHHSVDGREYFESDMRLEVQEKPQ